MGRKGTYKEQMGRGIRDFMRRNRCVGGWKWNREGTDGKGNFHEKEQECRWLEEKQRRNRWEGE